MRVDRVYEKYMGHYMRGHIVSNVQPPEAKNPDEPKFDKTVPIEPVKDLKPSNPLRNIRRDDIGKGVDYYA